MTTFSYDYYHSYQQISPTVLVADEKPYWIGDYNALRDHVAIRAIEALDADFTNDGLYRELRERESREGEGGERGRERERKVREEGARGRERGR